MIIDHIGIAVSDYDRSKGFFCRALAPLGIELVAEVEGWAGLGKAGKPAPPQPAAVPSSVLSRP